MTGFKPTLEMVKRELTIQSALSLEGATEVLNIPLVMGGVGLGKSAMARAAAADFALHYVPINSGENSDSTDVAGMPDIRSGQVFMGDRVPYTQYSLNEAAATACTSPCLLFFDDIDKAPPAVQSALLGIMGTRMFRNHALHPGTLIMAAGNRIEDDEYANTISESLKTRATTYILEADLKSFSEYGVETGDIHPTVIGYLQYAPAHLHKHAEDVIRFPTPRGWREASRHLKVYPDPHEMIPGTHVPNWKHIVSSKCGEAVGNDYWAWFEILSKVDVPSILAGSAKYDRAGADKRIWEYAAVFAIASHFNTKGVKKTDTGVSAFLTSIGGEMRVALAVQLTPAARTALIKHFPDAAASMMKVITQASMPTKKTP